MATPSAGHTSRPCLSCSPIKLSEQGEGQVVLGVDVGTSSLKAGLFALDGTPLGLTQAEYPLSAPEEGAEEQDPEDWWAALASVSRELMALLDDRSRLAAVAIGGQAPTLVAADADFRP